jgi:acyl transferase domain-containing protein/acyl carrier protein/NADP-dependent 3-hydroxy acid dehydrogenase YdfG
MNDTAYHIAIIGMDCRIPGASNTNEFWANLINGTESITEFTRDELIASGESLKNINNPKYVPRRGIVEGVDMFDAGFFGFTPREAELLDPQQRIFLETCWHALEDGGYSERNDKIRVGVFGGSGTAWYLNDIYNNPKVKKYADSISVVTSSDKDYLTTRVSYKLNLNGPSLNIQSACSTSMAATILGIQSLLDYQSDLVLAGGVSVQYPEKVGYLYVPGSLESPDGHCRPFDKEAGGTAFSRGCGVVLLKRYDEAVKDGDYIYAVINGSAMNNDGNKKVGYTAPSIQGQKEVILEAIESAGISAREIDMVEAHGTATPVGDPIEVSSLSEAFREYTSEKQFCALGSVKSNIGHTDAASGIISIIKTALSLKHKIIPASINYTEANPKIDFENSPFFVNTSLREWKKEKEGKMTALINSFGVGGTNACLIMQNPPETKTNNSTGTHKYNILAVSTMSSAALDVYQENIKEFIQNHNHINPTNLSFTSLAGRKHFKNRTFVVYEDLNDLQSKIANGKWRKNKLSEDNRQLVFMFPGQGNQYINMGKDLYDKYPVFKDTVDRCADLLQSEINLDIRTVIFQKENRRQNDELINQTYITQPALFIISYAQAQLLISWGIKPSYLIGHSVGEYVAATLSGVFSLEEALFAVARRGRLIQNLSAGAMTAVLLSEEEVIPLLEPSCSIGALNSPGLSVISGPFEDIEKLEQKLSNKKIFNKRIPTSHAFHSAMMEPMIKEFSIIFENISLKEPLIPIVSTVTGQILSHEEAQSADYWTEHVRKTVRFSDAISTAMTFSPSVFVEAGPGQSLESATKRHFSQDTPHAVLSTMPAAGNNENGLKYLANALGNFWSYGLSPNWNIYFSKSFQNRIPFPLYPYDRKRYIVERASGQLVSEEEIVKEPDISQWVYRPYWKKSAGSKILLHRYLSGIKQEEEVTETNNYLVFGDNNKLTNKIIDLLKSRNENIILAGRDDNLDNKGKYDYVINPGKKEDYKQLLNGLNESGFYPNRIIHLWNVEEHTTKPNSKNCNKTEEIAYYSPLYLEQSLIENESQAKINILMVANGVFSVFGEKIHNPLKALAIGPTRSIHRESKRIKARFIDLDLQYGKMENTADQLINEVDLINSDLVVALRGEQRWVEGFEKFYLPKPANQHFVFKNNGIYLITGGTGGLGIEFAKHIAGQVNAHIILTSRSSLPERNKWHSLPENSSSNTLKKIKAIEEIEKSGSKVYLIKADVSNLSDMRNVGKFVKNKWGKLTGIIHSAGTAGGGIIALKTKEMSDEVLTPKTKGTLIIDEIFDKDDMDFIVYFSSATAVIPEPSRVDYTGANSFLDAYSFYRNQNFKTKTYSINWHSWSKVGMAARWKEIQETNRRKHYLNEQTKTGGLHFIGENNGEEIYQLGFDDQTDWVYKEHLVAGQYTIVGTFIIDVFTRFLLERYKGLNPHISDLYFMKPLYIAENQSPVIRLFVAPEKNGVRLRFSFLDTSKDRDQWVDAAIAFATGEELKPGESVEISSLLKNYEPDSDKPLMFQEVHLKGKEVLRYSNRWMNVKGRYRNNDSYFVIQQLDSVYHSDTDFFVIHPALLDTAVANVFQNFTHDFFLPFAYKSIKVYGKFSPKIYVRVIPASEIKSGSETAVFDLLIYDEKGNPIVEIQQYSLMNMTNKSFGEDTGNVTETPDNKDNILPEEGVEIFDRLLNFDIDSNMIVSPYNLIKEIEDALNDEEDSKEDDQEEAATYDRPEISTDYIEPTNEIEKTIAKIWGQILGIGNIGINDGFNELGGNSLLVVQAISNISQTFEIEIPLSEFKETSTVKELSEFIMNALIEDIDESELDELLNEIE